MQKNILKPNNQIIRAEKEKGNFVTVDKNFINDDRLSLKAKGLLLYILSKPNDWKVIVDEIENNNSDGKKSIYSGLKELSDLGYYKKVPVRDKEGKRILFWENFISEKPMEDNDFQLLQKEEIEEVKEETLEIQSREHNNNYINNNKITNIDFTKSSPVSPLKDDLMDNDYQTYKEIIKENIMYEWLVNSYKPNLKDQVDDVIEIMLRAICNKSSFIKIGNEEIPKEIVKSTFLKLEYEHILHSITKFNSQENKITNINSYMLKVLLNTKNELNSYYQNLYKTDFS